MKTTERSYEPPKLTAYQFDDNDQILTASGTPGMPDTPSVTPDPEPDPKYAANALNEYLGKETTSNTTIEAP